MNDRRIDVGIITIIPTEIKALLSIFGVKEKFQYDETSNANYLKTNMYSSASGRDISVVITFLHKKSGNTESAITTSRFLRDWYPRLMCLVGISAGIPDKTKIGDVILPAEIQDRQIKVYERGEYKQRTTTRVRTDFMDGLTKLQWIDLEKFRSLCATELASEIASAKHVINDKGIEIHDGSLVSDNILIKDEQFFVKFLTEVDQKCRGAEMEAAGFVRACEVENNLPWVISRGVSDFGDTSKQDTFHELAAKTACLALRELLTNCINIDKLPTNSRAKDFETTLEFNIIQQIRTAYQQKAYDKVCKIASILPLSRYFWLSGQHQLRIEIGEIVVNAAGYIEENKLKAAYLIDDLGWTTFSLNSKDSAKAKNYIRDGLRLANELEDYYLSAKAHRHLAGIHLINGLLDETKKESELAVIDANNIVDEHEKNEMMAALKLGEAKLLLASENMDDKQKSVDAFESALAAFNANSDENRAVKVHVLLGNAYQALGNMDKAKNKYEEGLNKAYEIGRYDEIKSNTNALLSIVSDETYQTDVLKKIIAYCETCQLYSELYFWQKRYKETKYGK